MDNVYIGKLLSIVTFLTLFICAMIIVVTPTAMGYEISIYDAYPIYFWGLIIFAMFMGIIILIRSYLYENERCNWKCGFLSLLISNSILLTLALIRGYFFLGRNDVSSHMGLMRDILISGTFGTNVYPLLHILGVESLFIPNFPLNIIILIYPAIFSLFCIFSLYLLFNRIYDNKKDVILGMVPASILLFGTYHTMFTPNQEAFLLIPFFLYCYLSSRKSDNKLPFTILTVIMSIVLTVLHPLVSLMTILLLIIIELSNIISSKHLNTSRIRNPYTVIVLMATVFFMWQTYTYIFFKKIIKIFNWFIGEELGNSELQIYSTIISSTDPNIIDLIHRIFNIYGQLLIVSLISLVCIFYLLKKRNKLDFFNIFYSLGFIFSIIISVLSLVLVYIFQFARNYVLAILMGIFLVYIFLKLLLSTTNKLLNKKYIKPLIIAVIFIPLLVASTFNLYYSPPTNYPNEQVTFSEYQGMQTFFEKRDDSFRAYEYKLSQTRFFDAIYYYQIDTNKHKFNISSKNLRYVDTMPIDHFGYDNYTSMADYYNKSSYLLINDLGKDLYASIYPQYKDKWRFTPDDFEKLNYDNGLSLIYDNSNLEIYFLEKK